MRRGGERQQVRQTLLRQPANRPAPGTAVVTDKGLSGEETEEFFTSPDLGLTLVFNHDSDQNQPASVILITLCCSSSYLIATEHGWDSRPRGLR